MLVLLDIDGVMVIANSWKSPEILTDGFPAFSHKAVSALKKILSETDARIILTTSHKANYSISEWIGIFSLRGININTIELLHDSSVILNRKDEILNWFKAGVFNDSFVIIDDDKSLNDLPPFLKDKLVLTSSSIGLTADLAGQAIYILRKELLHV